MTRLPPAVRSSSLGRPCVVCVGVKQPVRDVWLSTVLINSPDRSPLWRPIRTVDNHTSLVNVVKAYRPTGWLVLEKFILILLQRNCKSVIASSELLKYFTMADHPTLLDGGSFSWASGNYLGPFTVGNHLSEHIRARGCLNN